MHKLEVILQMVYVRRGFSRDIQGLKKTGLQPLKSYRARIIGHS
jgi:hypothetical protein